MIKTHLVVGTEIIEIDDPLFRIRLVATTPKARLSPVYKANSRKIAPWLLWLLQILPGRREKLTRVRWTPVINGEEILMRGSYVGGKIWAQQRMMTNGTKLLRQST